MILGRAYAIPGTHPSCDALGAVAVPAYALPLFSVIASAWRSMAAIWISSEDLERAYRPGEPFSTLGAWLSLLLDAAPTGQSSVSLRVLAARWSWSRMTVSRFLDSLEARGDIRINPMPDGSRIEIVDFLTRFGGTPNGTLLGTPKANAPGDLDSESGQEVGRRMGQAKTLSLDPVLVPSLSSSPTPPSLSPSTAEAEEGRMKREPGIHLTADQRANLERRFGKEFFAEQFKLADDRVRDIGQLINNPAAYMRSILQKEQSTRAVASKPSGRPEHRIMKADTQRPRPAVVSRNVKKENSK